MEVVAVGALAHEQRVRPAHEAPRGRYRAVSLGVGLIALGVGLTANSLIGPFVTDAFGFRVTETLLNQMIGLDAVSLLVVAPLSVVGLDYAGGTGPCAAPSRRHPPDRRSDSP